MPSKRGNKRVNAQRDENEPSIVKTLEWQHKVQRYNELGAPDLGAAGPKRIVCPSCGYVTNIAYNSLIEIKMPGEGLNPNQVDWHRAWLERGGQVEIARSIDEALAIVAADHVQGLL